MVFANFFWRLTNYLSMVSGVSVQSFSFFFLLHGNAANESGC